ncbi:hypothetical protein ANO14919_103860 [Xylariales sp. No.14919]|nr:hypothetical protein ANO14919_103860 [Xylariales sp. No.14919]
MCSEAHRQGLDYAWVDTCYIDKASSAELGEAINSMFKWYRDAAICFTYLKDIKPAETGKNAPNAGVGSVGFHKSKWFTRGLALQELIASKRLNFYNEAWETIEEKSRLKTELEAITGIDAAILEEGPLRQVSVGRRMSWAVDRETTRDEDIAYSLFGDLRWRPRQSILGDNEVGLRDNLIRVWDSKIPTNPITTDNKGIRITNRLKDIQPYTGNRDFLILVLNCNFGGNPARTAGIHLRRQDDRYARIRPNEIADIQSGA